MPARLRRLRRRHGDRGITLVEIMTSTVLAVTLGGLVTTMVISTQRQTAAGEIRMADIDSARVGIDALTRVLRTAVQPAQLQIGCGSCIGPASVSTALTAAETDRLQLFANLGDAAGPFLITFAVEQENGTWVLTQKTQVPDVGSAPNFRYTPCIPKQAGCRISVRTLVRGLDWPAPTPMFVYRDNAADVLTAPGARAGLTPDQLLVVDSIDITLPVRTPNRVGAGGFVSATRVALPNSSTSVLATAVPMPEPS
ncbi:hypothetical protein GCM10009547_44580 [Sporichthya brevicatena]|uniref:Prepilin-type N-terminal cleavage/methylation domain-containing protein n=1 Tax=Sporichthya brevicatena TaxID=171442 RepID=A0ABP3SEP3_9ACTN